jgi:hypothetical protein
MLMSVLRVESPHALWAKALDSPVLLRLVTEPLTDPQLLMLLRAGPFEPVTVDATVGIYSHALGGFVATVHEVHSQARMPALPTPVRRSFGRSLK